MISINNYITEKLILNKNISSNKYFDITFYETCDIPDLDDQIQNKLNEIDEKNDRTSLWCVKYMPKHIKNKQGKNTTFYKFYSYIYYNGPTKIKDLTNFFNLGTWTLQFAEWKKLNIFSIKNGLLHIVEPKLWKIKK